LKEKLGPGEEREVVGDLRLIQGEHRGLIVELYFDRIETSCFNSPRLFADDFWFEPIALRVGNCKPQDILKVVFDRIPTRRPSGERELQAGLVDVLHIGGDVEKLSFDTCDRDCVVDAQRITFLSER